MVVDNCVALESGSSVRVAVLSLSCLVGVTVFKAVTSKNELASRGFPAAVKAT